MRAFGLKNLQAHIRHGIEMAKLLESHIKADLNFEVPAERHLGLVVFRLKAGNALTQELLRRLNQSGTMYLISAEIHTKRIIRFAVTSQYTTADDILKDWNIISTTAAALLAETEGLHNTEKPKLEEDDVIGAEETLSSRSEEKEDTVASLDNVLVDLWIDKAWIPSRRPMRSLSCNSDPLPHNYFSPQSSSDFKKIPSLRETAGGPPVPFLTDTSPKAKKKELPASLLGKEVQRKMEGMPSFCSQRAQRSPHQLCCPLTMSQTAQKHLSSTCRRMNCMSPFPSDTE